MHFDQAFDHRQPYSEAALRPIERTLALHEQVEDPWQQLRANATAGIGDCNARVLLITTGVDRDLPTQLCVFDGVRQNITHALRETREVSHYEQGLITQRRRG